MTNPPKRPSNIYRNSELKRQTDKGKTAYERARKKLLKQPELICHLCGIPIDKTLKYPHPMSFTADHVTPVNTTGTLAGEIRPAHNRCNIKRHDGAIPNWRKNVRDW